MEGENRGPRRPAGERVLLFGGTFDPPHSGHIHFLKSAIEAAKPARVVVMPSCIPPHKAASATPAALRLAMCQCFKPLFPALEVSGWEVEQAERGQRNYTVLTLEMLAAEHPEMFTRLVLTGAAGIRPKPTEAARKRSETYRKLKGLCEGAKKWKIFGTLPERAEESLRKKFGSRDYNALDAEMRQTFVKVISQDLTPYLPRIQQPTLLLWGTEDTETPLWMGQEMERSIPDAALIPLEGGSHFAYAEQPARFNAIVRKFLVEE